MFNRFWHDIWIPMFGVLIIIGIFSGYGLVIGLGAMGLLLAGVSWLWNRLSLEEVHYERDIAQSRVFMGEETTWRCRLPTASQYRWQAGRRGRVPGGDRGRRREVSTSANPKSMVLRHHTSLAWYERIHWEYTMKCGARGFYRIGPAKLESGDIFGFFDSEKPVRDNDFLLVYPRVVPLPELGMSPIRPLGETRGGIAIFQDPSRPWGIREYQVGDPPQDSGLEGHGADAAASSPHI